MGLFKKKQGDVESPRTMGRTSNFPVFPKYTEEVEKTRAMPSLPPLPKLPPPIAEPVYEEPEQEPEYRAPELEEFQLPVRRSLKPMLGEPINRESFFREPSNDSKPIFVKLEKYKSAINTISELKKKIKEAEDLLSEIEQIKSQEDREISNWQKQVSDIKAKLLEIDRNLFEV
ncbi:MAG: hypothetical protein AABX29_08250 [Nanoarchaeota archaeon]